MEDSKASVPYAVFEGTQVRNERTVKRLIIALVIALLTAQGKGNDSKRAAA